MAGMAPKDRVILRSEALTEYNSRYSFSLAGLALTLVGICFGITAQRRETSAGFILSLIVGLAYYAFIMLGALLKGRPEYHPELWVWAPNVIFGALGTYLFWRHQRR
jgi:lipopolysaccharide export system permease protein